VGFLRRHAASLKDEPAPHAGRRADSQGI
jgi:hypothetical protein